MAALLFMGVLATALLLQWNAMAKATFMFVRLFSFGFSRQSFSVALEPVPGTCFVDQSVLELTETCLTLPPES